MERKTPKEFEFVVKLNRVMTHSNLLSAHMFQTRVRLLAARLISLAMRICRRSVRLRGRSRELLLVQEGIEPFVDAGKLKCVLAQFPWGFKHAITCDRD